MAFLDPLGRGELSPVLVVVPGKHAVDGICQSSWIPLEAWVGVVLLVRPLLVSERVPRHG